MANKRLLFVILTLITVSFTLPAFARPGGPRGPMHKNRPGNHHKNRPGNHYNKPGNKHHNPKVNTKWENKADKNNDGFVQKAEYKHMNKNHKNHQNHQNHWSNHNKPPRNKVNNKKEAHWDKNNDGYVDKKEAHMKNGNKPHHKRFKKDVNGDGTVDWKDKKIIQSKHGNKGQGGPHHKPKLRDMNGDGVINNQDRKIMISKGHKPPKNKVNNKHEANMDQNNDGWVDKTEAHHKPTN
jgi:hypothetical protein